MKSKDLNDSLGAKQMRMSMKTLMSPCRFERNKISTKLTCIGKANGTPLAYKCVLCRSRIVSGNIKWDSQTLIIIYSSFDLN